MSLTPTIGPTELDAGVVRERLALISPEANVARRELAVYPESENGQRFRVVETTYYNDGTRDRDSERFFNLAQDCVIPLYAITRQPRVHWSVEVVYGNGIQRIAYSFRERADASRFQQYFTGFRPTHFFEYVKCTLTFKSEKLFLGKIAQDPQYHGCGEVQFWWPDGERNQPATVGSPTSSRSSSQEMSIRSTIPEIVRRSTVLSVQTDVGRDRELVVMDQSRPPALVAFLQNDQGYTMLRTDITRLQHPPPQHSQVNVEGAGGKTFAVDMLSVKKSQLDGWNLCAFDRAALLGPSPVSCMRSTYLTLDFSGTEPERSAEMNRFDKILLWLQYRQQKLEANRSTDRAKLYQAQPLLSSTSPTNASNARHAPPMAATTFRLPASISLQPLPPVSVSEPLSVQIAVELENERARRELDGSAVAGPYEMDGGAASTRRSRRSLRYFRR